MKTLIVHDKFCNCKWRKRIAEARRSIPAFFLYALLSVSLAACSSQGSQNLSENPSETQAEATSPSKAQEGSTNPSESQEGSTSPSEAQENSTGSSESQEGSTSSSKTQEGSTDSSNLPEGSTNPPKTQDSSDQKTDAEQESILDANASDEELLEVLKDDIHVVSEEDFQEIATGILDNTAEYIGQIYQLEGVYTMEGETPYLANATEEGVPRLPLKYLKSDFREGEKIRITGIANQDKDTDSVAVLEVIVAESLDGTES